jgi:Tol biopolymer transport system component
MNINGRPYSQLTNNPDGSFRPNWAPDGRLLIFHAKFNENFHIFKMTSNGSEQTRLTESGNNRNAVWYLR